MTTNTFFVSSYLQQKVTRKAPFSLAEKIANKKKLSLKSLAPFFLTKTIVKPKLVQLGLTKDGTKALDEICRVKLFRS